VKGQALDEKMVADLWQTLEKNNNGGERRGRENCTTTLKRMPCSVGEEPEKKKFAEGLGRGNLRNQVHGGGEGATSAENKSGRHRERSGKGADEGSPCIEKTF